MTPAETLRAASQAIDVYLDELPGTPWRAELDDDHLDIYGSLGWMTCTSDDRYGPKLTSWIILSPTLLRMVGEYLEDLAGDAEEMPADMRAVAIAEVVLAALTEPDESAE